MGRAIVSVGTRRAVGVSPVRRAPILARAPVGLGPFAAHHLGTGRHRPDVIRQLPAHSGITALLRPISRRPIQFSKIKM